MSAAARGAAGAIVVRARRMRMRHRVPTGGIDQAARHFSRFIKNPERALELATEAARISTAPKGARRS